ncbi:MAG: phosphotransacetylase family protein [Chloroflexi bacterium]|nr:phosphotransacetylase family protein [Chloroflexota bacterium]
MTALLVTSCGEAAGKSTFCVGLGRYLQAQGRKVGYFKPFRRLTISAEDETPDEDALFIKKMLALEEEAKALAPTILNAQALEDALRQRGDSLISQVQGNFNSVAKNKDVVLVEDFQSLSPISQQLAQWLEAKILLVVRYRANLAADELIAAAEPIKGRLAGIVISVVPPNQIEEVWTSLAFPLGAENMKVLGVFPEDRLLFTLSVDELVRYLGGKILNSSEASQELVENLMVGAMVVDNAMNYFQVKANKTVITRGDRPDIQMAAIETSTRCLILTGNISPTPHVLNYATERGVPIAVVAEDTLATISRLSDIFPRIRFHQEKKIPQLGRLMNQYFNFPALFQALGLPN